MHSYILAAIVVAVVVWLVIAKDRANQRYLHLSFKELTGREARRSRISDICVIIPDGQPSYLEVPLWPFLHGSPERLISRHSDFPMIIRYGRQSHSYEIGCRDGKPTFHTTNADHPTWDDFVEVTLTRDDGAGKPKVIIGCNDSMPWQLLTELNR